MDAKPPKPPIEAPGLIWQWRRTSWTPYWRAPVKYRNEWKGQNLRRYVDRPDELVAQATALQNKFALWLELKSGKVQPRPKTIGELLRRYQTDPDSPYFSLRPSSRHPYDHYIARLHAHIGKKSLAKITGIDLKRWHETWSKKGERLAASKMTRAVLDAAVSYGIMCRIPECIELREVLKAAGRKLPAPRRREFTVTADDVVRLRAAAHADGRPSVALAYALVFETTLRLWDVIGQWWPSDAPGISDVVTAQRTSMKENKKWFGLRWEDIGPDLVMRYVPSKTSAKTGLAVTFPLARAPMVMEELTNWPEPRSGPVVVCEGTGLPWTSNYFGEAWRRDRAAAGLPDHIWARDLRASGITEGRASGVSTDDAAKVAGHASTKTTAAVYDRATLEAAERFADARVKKRGAKG